MASRTELLREKQFRRWKGSSPQDVEALTRFMEECCYIQHPEQGSILIPLRPAQHEILETWTSERYSIVLKARQIGWSTLVALYALWLAFFWPDQLILMLSKGEREAEKLLFKGTYAYDRLPEWLRARGPRRLTKNLKKLGLSNGSTIESLPSKEDPGRSATASLVIVDEWAFLENAEAAWASIEPIADVGGRVIGLSTANGSGDFFHNFWNGANAGVTGFKPMFYPWWANDDRDDDWYETKKRTMLEWQLHQEYPATPEEAFIKSGNPVFDVDALSRIECVEPISGHLDVLQHGIRAPQFRQSQGDGELRIWELPKVGEAYVLGADVAEGLEHGDYSSAHVISVKGEKVVANWHGHIDPDVFGERLVELCWFYNRALLGCEVNNHGLTTLKAAQRLGYPRIYFRRELDKRTEKIGTQIGWYTSISSKPLMIDELVMALRNELGLSDALTIAELRTYVRDERGKMRGSPYDDRVMSLAVANQMRKHVRLTDFKEPEDDYWTFDYFKAKVLSPPSFTMPIGTNNVRA